MSLSTRFLFSAAMDVSPERSSSSTRSTTPSSALILTVPGVIAQEDPLRDAAVLDDAGR